MAHFLITFENDTSGVLDDVRVEVEDGEDQDHILRRSLLNLLDGAVLTDGDSFHIRRV